jgi:hypothetical protein
MEFLPTSGGDVVAAIIGQFMQPEPYWVSTIHLLRGYRILNIPFTLIAGLLLVIATGCVLMRMKRSGIPIVLAVLIASTLLYELRFAADLLAYTDRHLTEWWTHHTYAEQQDLFTVAQVIQKNIDADHDEHTQVSICFDSTDYYAKVFRYLLYPVPVSIVGGLNENVRYVAVTRKGDWSYENGMLQCGTINHRAEKIQSFNDGTVLFRIPKT